MKISPTARQILDFIAQGEAPGYDVLFGGHKFSSMADHPRIAVKLKPGLYTHAAGRYQMQATTWDEQKQRLGLKDFGPESQDAAAWDLAQRTYKRKTGRDLESDGARAQVDWGALTGQWPSLNRAVAKPVKLATGALSAPQLTDPPELSSLLAEAGHPLSPLGRAAPASATAGGVSLDALTQLFPKAQFVPVDYNPFAVAPHLEPVDHDPFEQENSQ